MFAKMLGAVWLVSGAISLFKPAILKNRFQKKTSRKLKFIVYGFIIFFAFSIISSAFGARGFFLKIVGIAGMLVVIKSILALTSRASERMLEWLAERRLGFFRLCAAVMSATGIMLLLR